MPKPLVGKRICVVHPGTPKLDFRLKKTTKALTDAGAEVFIVAYLERQEDEDFINDGVISLHHPGPYMHFKASNNKIWLVRVAWNLTVIKVQEFLARSVERSEGLAQIAARLDVDLFYFINADTAIEANRLRRITKRPIVYDAYEYFPALLKDELYFAIRKKNAKFYRAEKELVTNSANKVIVVGDEIADGYVKRYSCERPTVVYNAAPAYVDEVTAPGEAVKFYFQSFLRPTYNIEGLIEGFNLVDGPASLTIQGKFFDDAYEKEIKELIKRSPKDIELLPPFDYKDAISMASKYDVGVCSVSARIGDKNNQNVQLALPNKLFTYMGAGLALAFSDYPAQKRVASEHCSGIAFNPESIASTAECFQWFVDNKDKIFEMKRGSLITAKKYSLAQQEKMVVEVCSDAITEYLEREEESRLGARS